MRTTGPTRRWRAALAVLVAVHLVVLYAPDAGGELPFPNADKLVHVATFASVALAGLRAGLAARWWVPVLAGHAGLSEVVQLLFLPHRSGDPMDVLANLVGVLVGVLGAGRVAWASWGGDRPRPRGAADRTAAGRDPGAG